MSDVELTVTELPFVRTVRLSSQPHGERGDVVYRLACQAEESIGNSRCGLYDGHPLPHYDPLQARGWRVWQ